MPVPALLWAHQCCCCGNQARGTGTNMLILTALVMSWIIISFMSELSIKSSTSILLLVSDRLTSKVKFPPTVGLPRFIIHGSICGLDWLNVRYLSVDKVWYLQGIWKQCHSGNNGYQGMTAFTYLGTVTLISIFNHNSKKGNIVSLWWFEVSCMVSANLSHLIQC